MDAAAAPPRSVMNSRRFTAQYLRCFRPKGSHSPAQQTAASLLLRGTRGSPAPDNLFQGGKPKTGHPTYRASNRPHTKIIFIQISGDEVRMKVLKLKSPPYRGFLRRQDKMRLPLMPHTPGRSRCA